MKLIIIAIKNESGRYTGWIQQLEFILFEADTHEELKRKARSMVTMWIEHIIDIKEDFDNYEIRESEYPTKIETNAKKP